MTAQSLRDEVSPLLDDHNITHAGLDNAARQPKTHRVFNRTNTPPVLRIAATMYSFAVIGLFTSTIGALLPSISHHYALNDTRVSLIFLLGPIGYVFAAQTNAYIHTRFGQVGVATIGPIFHIVSAGVIALHPPFPVLLLSFIFAAIGTGLLDGSWCAWAGGMSKANTISGMLHGSFSVGAAVGPFLAGALMIKGLRPWYEWYYILAGASVVELAVLVSAFRDEDASKYAQTKATALSSLNSRHKHIYSHKATWLAAAYFLAYVGTENAISGWVVSFLLRARHATPAEATLPLTGFWSGMAIGRFVLGAVAERIGVLWATVIYLTCAIGLELLFASIRVSVASIIFMTLLGFSMGPLFPSGIVLLNRLLPKDLHVGAVSFVASVGQIGAAIFPFGIGALVDMTGIGLFQYAIVALTTVTLVLWVLFSSVRPAATVTVSGADTESIGA